MSGAQESLAAGHDAFVAALSAGDIQAVDQLIASEFFVTGLGRRRGDLNRQEFLELLRDKKLDYRKIKLAGRTVAVHGQTGTIRGRSHRRGSFENSQFQASSKVLSVWSQEGGAWKLVAVHLGRAHGAKRQTS